MDEDAIEPIKRWGVVWGWRYGTALVVPWHLGLCWPEFVRNTNVVALIPFNWIAAIVRWVYIHVKKGPRFGYGKVPPFSGSIRRGTCPYCSRYITEAERCVADLEVELSDAREGNKRLREFVTHVLEGGTLTKTDDGGVKMGLGEPRYEVRALSALTGTRIHAKEIAVILTPGMLRDPGFIDRHAEWLRSVLTTSIPPGELLDGNTRRLANELAAKEEMDP